MFQNNKNIYQLLNVYCPNNTLVRTRKEIVSVCGNTMCYLNYREAEVQVLNGIPDIPDPSKHLHGSSRDSTIPTQTMASIR